MNTANLSKLVHGHWRLGDWNLSNQELLTLTKECINLGITSFDHADIYGNHSCEALFGKALKLEPQLRNQIQIISKCGIQLVSNHFPERKTKHYDYSYEHIVSSVENSLQNFGTDRLDLLLLHRPAPFFNPEEVAKAFSHLKQKGMVLQFGVSNFSTMQFEMLQKFSDEKLVTNQVEISPYCLEHFENGNIDFMLKEQIQPMAWSPLAGGRIFSTSDEKGARVLQALQEVAEEMKAYNIDSLIYAWLLKHPVQIIPIIGSGKLDRIQKAVEAVNLEMSLEQWYKIYIAAAGEELP